MARTVANLDVTSDTFQNWVNKTDELLYSLTTEIITGNSSIANTGTTLEPRKAQLLGRFGANTLVATNELRGGNVGDSGYALLTVTSSTLFGGNSSANASYVNAQANVFVNNAVLQVNSETITITGNTSIKGNTSVTAITVTGNATVSNTIIAGTDLFVTAVNTSVNSRSIFTGNTYIKANSTITNITVQGNGTTANTILAGNLTQITSNLDVTGTLHTIAGNVNFDSATLFVDATNNRVGINNNAPDAVFVVTGTANVSGASQLSNTLSIIGAATLANTLNVVGAVTFSNTVAITGTTTINTDYVIQVTANGNLGATVGSPLLVYSFPKATYSSAKLTSQIKTISGNTQISEIVLAHDTTTPYITVYAAVVSPLGANNGIYSVAINNANVELKFTQTSASSNARIIAHLIK